MSETRSATRGLALGMGLVAGLRSTVAPALLSWALARDLIRIGDSLLWPVVSQGISRRTARLALRELIADKLPLTPARIDARPLATRVLSGAACGAVVSVAGRRPVLEGMGFGALGAVAGAYGGHFARGRLNHRLPRLAVALLEDAVAITAGTTIIWQLARNQQSGNAVDRSRWRIA